MTTATLNSNDAQALSGEDIVIAEGEEVLPFKYSITSYGADYPVDGLVKRLAAGDVFVPTFQRDYVWTVKQASRFIESLLLGLPVPGIFLSKEPDTGKLLVIDGQQRLRSLQYFYLGVFEPTRRTFELVDVVPAFAGKTYQTLEEEDRRRLDDSILHATIVKQDDPSEDQSSVYFIFERLNTGGVLLQPQQIRASIYHGLFQDLLKELNENAAWRAIYGPASKAMRDQELILRFLALHFSVDTYDRPMKNFLNTYMAKNRALRSPTADQFRQAFVGTIETVQRCLGDRVFRVKKALNAAVFDAVMVGIARRLAHAPIKTCESLRKAYANLLSDPGFVATTAKATADKESVSRRIDLAIKCFSKVK